MTLTDQGDQTAIVNIALGLCQRATFAQGSEIVASSATLIGGVHGTAPISRVRLVAQVMDPAFAPDVLVEEDDPGSLDVERIMATATSAPAAYWLEVLQVDGHQAVSSPIFLTGDCARVAEGAADPESICASAPASRRCGCDTRGTGAAPFFFSLLLMGVRRR